MGNGDLRSEGAVLGGLRGTGPALAGIVREVGDFALSRDGEIGCCDPMLAAVQPRCRRCVAGVWVCFRWGGVDGGLGFGIRRCVPWGLCGAGPAFPGIVRCAGDSFVILQSCWHRNQLRAGFAVSLGSFSCV